VAISSVGQVITSALWPQGDSRDPLGLWGMRALVTGDATGSSIKLVAQVPAADKAAYVYTVYSAIVVQLTGSVAGFTIAKLRILTNWPNVDDQPGVQAYNAVIFRTAIGSLTFTAPTKGSPQLVTAIDRFLLLFDPRPSGDDMDILELEIDDNVDAATYSFEAYGYFWDRSVMQAPGGPRHPGSS